MSNRLKQITTKAKALYKSGKYAKWTDAIKAASKQTATVGATKKKTSKKKTAPKKKTVVRKLATKKKATTRNYGSHKDTKSHNVRISVVSGVKSDAFKKIDEITNLIIQQSALLERLQKAHKASKSKINREMLMMDIKTLKNSFIPHNKRYLKSLKSTLKKGI
jgi:hypothetical protein